MRLAEMLEKTVAVLKSDGFRYFLVESEGDPTKGLEEGISITKSFPSEDPRTWEIGLTSISFNSHAGNSPRALLIIQKFDEMPYGEGWQPV